MGTGNFTRYDAPYTYVPKIFKDEEHLEYDMLKDEMEYISSEVYDKVDKLSDIYIKLKPYKNWEIYIANVKNFGFDIYVTNENEENKVEFLYLDGYYEMGNFDYITHFDDKISKEAEELLLKILYVIDGVLEQYCDIY